MMVTRIKRGVYGGVAGGVVFGGMMGMMGMLTMIGSMVGSSSAWVRIPDDREHRFQSNVNTDSGHVEQRFQDGEHGFRGT